MAFRRMGSIKTPAERAAGPRGDARRRAARRPRTRDRPRRSPRPGRSRRASGSIGNRFAILPIAKIRHLLDVSALIRGKSSYMPGTMFCCCKAHRCALVLKSAKSPIPQFGPREVLVKVKVAFHFAGLTCTFTTGTGGAQGRIHPPLIPGHEFCGEVAAFGSEVTSVKEGDFVSAEMHVACGKCLQCRTGDAHVCQKREDYWRGCQWGICGVCCDSGKQYLEAGFRRFLRSYASILDPLGNAVHTVLAGEIAGRNRGGNRGAGRLGYFRLRWRRGCGSVDNFFALEINETSPSGSRSRCTRTMCWIRRTMMCGRL